MKKPLVFGKRQDLVEFVRECRTKRQRIGFVPTMGALHEGHGSLLAKSVEENEVTLLSIFVNPIQFGKNEDFSTYPRTFSSDLELATSLGVTAVFSPTIHEMYPQEFLTTVSVAKMSEGLCGQFRQGHFDGVCTVVLLLLNLVQADRAYFGMKDFQQLQIIKRMCTDLGHPTQIIGCPTVRENDGLAMSSRNRYLDNEGRKLASFFPKALAAGAALFLEGERSVEKLLNAVTAEFQAANLVPQYLEARTLPNLESLTDDIERGCVLAAAVPIMSGSSVTRLIDNIVLLDDEFHRMILEDLCSRVSARSGV